MALFDRSHTISYSFPIETIAISCIVSEISEILVENRDFSFFSAENGHKYFHDVFFTTEPVLWPIT